MPEKWDYETDVLVIGYGGAGVWAALTASDEGESEVLILEKSPTRGGGNSSINLGEFTNISDADGAFNYVKNFCKGKTHPMK
jgi:succinate dehydrogenase/fumarate reductase flavoprotein subunit